MEKALIAMSGGVDSSVAALLTAREPIRWQLNPAALALLLQWQLLLLRLLPEP